MCSYAFRPTQVWGENVLLARRVGSLDVVQEPTEGLRPAALAHIEAAELGRQPMVAEIDAGAAIRYWFESEADLRAIPVVLDLTDEHRPAYAGRSRRFVNPEDR